MCSTSTSVICREMRRNGFSEVIGSWKIIDSVTPRMRFSRRAGQAQDLLPAEAHGARRPAVARQQAHDGEEHLRLARAALADDAEALALADR